MQTKKIGTDYDADVFQEDDEIVYTFYGVMCPDNIERATETEYFD